MKSAVIQIWFEGDVGPASIEYVKTYKGKSTTAHERFLKDAMRKFPNWADIEIRTV